MMEVKYIVLLLFLIQISTSYCSVITECTNGGTVGMDPSSYTSHITSAVSGTGFLIEHHQYQFLCCGLVTQWEISSTGGDIQLQVWRKTGRTYKLIGKNKFTAALGAVTLTVPSTERIMVQHGDYIGWYSEGAVLHYGTQGVSDAVLNRQALSMTDPSPRDTYDWFQKDVYRSDIFFAVRATTATDTTPSFANIPGSPISIPEETPKDTVVLTISITDDASDTLTLIPYYVVDGYFDIDVAGRRIKTATDRTPEGTYKIGLKVWDTCYKTATATVTFKVANTPLTMDIVGTSVTLDEQMTSEQWLTDIEVVEPVDPVYCWMSSSGDYPFIVRHNKTGDQIYSLYVQDWPEFDTSARSSYNLEVSCQDGGVTVKDTYTVTITTSNNKPTITNLPASTSVNARTSTIGTVVYTVSASDAENDSLVYSISCGSCPFDILDSGKIVLTEKVLDHATSSYNVVVEVRDDYSDSPYNSGTLTVSITNANVKPSISVSTINNPIAENTPKGTSVMTFSATDTYANQPLPVYLVYASAFGYKYLDYDVTSGLLTTSAVTDLDYETLPVRDFIIYAYASDGFSLVSSTATVSINDVNEKPKFAHRYYRVIGEEGRADDKFPIPAYGVVDPDSGDTLLFTKSCGVSHDNDVKIKSGNGEFSFAKDYDLDLAGTENDFNCTVIVTDSLGLTDLTTVGVHIDYVNEYPPTFPFASTTLIVHPEELVGSIISNITASDKDFSTHDHGMFYYTLNQSSLTERLFGVMPNGSIFVAKDLSPFYNGYNGSMVLTATDRGGRSGTVSVAVEISVFAPTPAPAVIEKTLDFPEDNRNMAIVTLGGIAGIGIICTAGYLLHRYKSRRSFAKPLEVSEASPESQSDNKGQTISETDDKKGKEKSEKDRKKPNTEGDGVVAVMSGGTPPPAYSQVVAGTSQDPYRGLVCLLLK